MGGTAAVASETSDFDHHRLDVVGLDVDDNIVVTVEVERINRDLRRAAPEDYEKVVACDPEEAPWVAMSNSEGHEILAALRDPLEGEPRLSLLAQIRLNELTLRFLQVLGRRARCTAQSLGDICSGSIAWYLVESHLKGDL